MILTVFQRQSPLSCFYIALSLAANLVILLFALVYAVRRKVTGGSDLILLPLLKIRWLGSLIQASPLATCMILGTVLSALVGIVLPWKAKGEYFATGYGLVTVLNFVLIASFGVGVYFRLRLKAAEFFRNDTLHELGLRLNRPWRVLESPRSEVLYQLALVFSALSVQYSAIVTEVDFALPETAWIDRAGDTNHFNAYGAAFYAMRGLLSYLGLGLVATGLRVFVETCLCLEAVKPQYLFSVGYRVNPKIRPLANSVLLCVPLGFLTVLQGAVLLMVVRASPGNPMQVFLQATWIFWVLITAIGIIMAIGIIQRLQYFLSLGKDSIEKAEFARLTRYNPGSSWEHQTGAQAGEDIEMSLRQYSSYWEARVKLREAIDRIGTSPVPWGSNLGIAGAIIVQILGVTIAAFELLRGIPK